MDIKKLASFVSVFRASKLFARQAPVVTKRISRFLEVGVRNYIFDSKFALRHLSEVEFGTITRGIEIFQILFNVL